MSLFTSGLLVIIGFLCLSFFANAGKAFVLLLSRKTGLRSRDEKDLSARFLLAYQQMSGWREGREGPRLYAKMECKQETDQELGEGKAERPKAYDL